MDIWNVESFINSYLDFDYGLACVIALFIFGGYLWYTIVKNKEEKKKITKKQIVCGLLVSVYFVLILGGTLLNRSLGRDYDVKWQLFWSYKAVLETKNTSLLEQIVYNILVFIPWGFLFAETWERMQKLKWNVGLAFVCSAAIELSQLIFRCGLFEFDDMLHNTLGAFLGWCLWKLYQKIKKQLRTS